MADENFDVSAIFDRIGQLTGAESDAQRGKVIGISGQEVYRHKKNGTVPYKHILAAFEPEHWPYILRGMESGGKPNDPVTRSDLLSSMRTIHRQYRDIHRLLHHLVERTYPEEFARLEKRIDESLRELRGGGREQH